MLGQYQPLSTYHLPSAPILTVPIPNLPVIVAEKALESLSSPPPSGGNERCILSCERYTVVSRHRIESVQRVGVTLLVLSRPLRRTDAIRPLVT
jgi:hypothetical protein